MSESKIPRIIHYCWLSNDPVPEQMQKCMQSWKKHLVNYEFKLWNFDIFDKNLSLWVKQAFDAKKYAFAADYIRLYAVYTYGGIYMDMDVEVLKPFDDLLHNDLMFAYEDEENKYLEAGCFGAAKGNIFIRKCLEYYSDRPFIKETGDFDTVPLPQIITQIYNNMIMTPPFTFDYFTAKSWKTGELYTTRNTYSIHHFEGSWVDGGLLRIRKDCLKKLGVVFTAEEEEIYLDLLNNRKAIKTREELFLAVNMAEKISIAAKESCKNKDLDESVSSLVFLISEKGIQNKITSLKLYFTVFRRWKILKTPRSNLRSIYHCLRNLL